MALKGQPLSPELRARISATMTGKKLTEEHKAAIRAGKTNVSTETRDKMSKAKLGRTYTPEHKAAMSAGQFRRWAKTKAKDQLL